MSVDLCMGVHVYECRSLYECESESENVCPHVECAHIYECGCESIVYVHM